MMISDIVKLIMDKDVPVYVTTNSIHLPGYTVKIYSEWEEVIKINSGNYEDEQGLIKFTIMPEGLPEVSAKIPVKEFESKIKNLDPMFSFRMTFGLPVYESDVFNFTKEVEGYNVTLSKQGDEIIGECNWKGEIYRFPVIPDEI